MTGKRSRSAHNWHSGLKSLGRQFFLNKDFLVILAGFLCVYSTWWLAFYPGVLTPDSLDQWRQVIFSDYNNAHPFTATLLLSAFRWLHDTPAWMGLIHIATLSTILASFLTYAIRRGISKKIIIPIGLFFAIWPVFGIYSVTIWKDILYSLAIMATAVLSFVILIDKRLAAKRYPFILLVVSATMVALLRHNGLVYLVLPFLCLSIFVPTMRKKVLWSFSASLAIYIIMSFGVAQLMQVKPSPIMAEWLRMKTVGALYSDPSANITPEERRIFESFMPREAWIEGYDCERTDGTAIKFGEYRQLEYTDHIDPNPQVEKAWQQAVMSAALRNPSTMIKDRWCVTLAVLNWKKGSSKYATNISKHPKLPIVKENSFLPDVRKKMTQLLKWSSQSQVHSFVFWSGLPYLVLTLIYLGLAIFRRMHGTIVYILLALAGPITVGLVGFSSDFRYIYSLVLTAPLIILVYIVEKRIVASRKYPE